MMLRVLDEVRKRGPCLVENVVTGFGDVFSNSTGVEIRWGHSDCMQAGVLLSYGSSKLGTSSISIWWREYGRKNVLWVLGATLPVVVTLRLCDIRVYPLVRIQNLLDLRNDRKGQSPFWMVQAQIVGSQWKWMRPQGREQYWGER